MWHVYLVRCSDDTLYCGVAKDVAKRLREHNLTRKGARYTRARRPVVLVFQEPQPSKAAALRREAQIKRMRKARKEGLVSSRGC